MLATLDLARFFTKWLGDIRDSQAESGQLPVIVPSSGWGFTDLSPATEWPTVYPFLLREMYRSYGDERLLHEHWDSLTRYLAWELDRVEDGLSVSVLGDWLPPGFGSGPAPEDRRLTGTAYLYRALIAAAEIGDIIGTAQRLPEGRGRARRRPEPRVPGSRGRASTGRPTTRTTGRRPTPYRWRSAWCPDELVERVAANLAADVEARGFHLNTGCLGVGVLLPVLTAHGYGDAATKVALQRTYPSWGYWFDLGADTMWEKWEDDSRSRNHYFQGTVVQWIFENVAGLRNVDAGWERIVVRPDARGEVDSARSAPRRSAAGCRWRGRRRAGCCRWTCRFRSVRRPRSTYRPRLRRTSPPYRLRSRARRRTRTGYTIYTVPAGQWSFTSRSA